MAKFRVRTEYIFSGFFDIEAENEAQAREYVEKHCGLVIGSDIHSIIRKSKNPAKPKRKVQNPAKIGENHNSKRLLKYKSRNIGMIKKSIGSQANPMLFFAY